jgi:ELWxxDGT repeat protein
MWVGAAADPPVHLAMDINTISKDGVVDIDFKTCGGQFYFFSQAEGEKLAIDGYSLWCSDGTTEGTRKVADIDGVPTREAACTGDRFIFVTRMNERKDPATPFCVWSTDGTTAGTHCLMGPVDGTIGTLFGMDGYCYFLANFEWTSSTSGYTLWRTNGSATGIELVRSIPFEWWCTSFAKFGGGFVFSGRETGSEGISLWMSNGSSSGTTRLAAIPCSKYMYDPWPLTVAGGRLFQQDGQALWTSDGTQAGTSKIGDTVESTRWSLCDTLGAFLLTEESDSRILRCVNSGGTHELLREPAHSQQTSISGPAKASTFSEPIPMTHPMCRICR